MALVTLAAAQDHLRDYEAANEPDIERKILQASSIIFDYLKVADGTWPDSDDLVPPLIEAATLLVLGSLYKDREGAVNPISPAVEDILRRYRDPALS